MTGLFCVPVVARACVCVNIYISFFTDYLTTLYVIY